MQYYDITYMKYVLHIKNPTFCDGKAWPESGSGSALTRIDLAPWIQIRIDVKSWTRNRIETKQDPQHWFKRAKFSPFLEFYHNLLQKMADNLYVSFTYTVIQIRTNVSRTGKIFI